MPTVTSIKSQKNKKRVNIYLDDKFGFGLDLETFVKSGIKVGQELSESDVTKIVKEGEFQKTYEKVLHFASLRPRSEEEFKYWFKKHKVHNSIIPELLNRLKRLDFLNDEKFARWWIDSRLTFKTLGPTALKMELVQKGIDRGLVNNLIDEMLGNNMQIELAKKLLEKKRTKWESLTGFEKRKKMSEILRMKGFSWDIIRQITSVDD